MKRIVIILLSLVLCVSFNYVSAESNSESISLDELFEIVDGGNIIIDGENNSLYKVFKNQSNALTIIKGLENEYINNISERFELDELDDSNWYQYYEVVMNDFEDDSIRINRQSIELLYDFFDIYENSTKNDYIRSVLSNKQLDLSVRNDLLFAYMPSHSCFSQRNINNKSMNLNSYNRTNAIAYATAHATNRAGISQYYSYSKDCTNFASQILENGGVPQNNTGSQLSGWWHTVTQTGTPSNPIFTHDRSNSWSMVIHFCAYCGTYMTFTNYSSFTGNLISGSVIAGDKTGDGDFDHVGYVTAVGSYSGQYGFIDHKIAQHTTDYHKWATTTSWPTSYQIWAIVIH